MRRPVCSVTALLHARLAHQVADATAIDTAGRDDPIVGRDDIAAPAAAGDALRGMAQRNAFERGLRAWSLR